jgi:hypothetical protein
MANQSTLMEEKIQAKIERDSSEYCKNIAELIASQYQKYAPRTDDDPQKIRGSKYVAPDLNAWNPDKMSAPRMIDDSSIARRYKNIASETMTKMSLDELIDASTIIELGKKNEKIPETLANSKNAYQYASMVLDLYRELLTREKAEMMIDDLNAQIIYVNKRTSDPTLGKYYYKKLMEE